MKNLKVKIYPYIFEYKFNDDKDFKNIVTLEDILTYQNLFSFLLIEDHDTKDMIYKKDVNDFTLYYKTNDKTIDIKFELSTSTTKIFSLYLRNVDDMNLYENKHLKNEKSLICIKNLKEYGFLEYIKNNFNPFKQGSMAYQLLNNVLIQEYSTITEIIFKENHPNICSFDINFLTATINFKNFNTIRKTLLKEKNKFLRIMNTELVKEAKNNLIVHGNLDSSIKMKNINFNLANKKIINELTALQNSLEKLLSDKSTIETDLQKFFYENKILINNVLGYPVSFSLKEVELLMQNSNNINKIDILTYAKNGQKLGIIEFKNDKKNLLSKAKKPYRNNLKGISSDVSTAVQQCSLYKTLLIQNLVKTVDPKLTKVYDGSVFYIDSIVIIGRDSCLKDSLSTNSFNAYKDSCNIIIKTYDEILEQIKSLIIILTDYSK